MSWRIPRTKSVQIVGFMAKCRSSVELRQFCREVQSHLDLIRSHATLETLSWSHKVLTLWISKSIGLKWTVFLGRSTNGSILGQCPFKGKLLMNLIFFALSGFVWGIYDDVWTLNCCIIGSSRAINTLYRKDKYQKTGHSDKINSTSFMDTEWPRRI